MLNVSVYDQSPSCDHLYFSKQVLFWGDYRVGDIAGRCHYSKPAELVSDAWDQKAEKLAGSSLMFGDSLSRETPAQGVQLKKDNLI